MIPRLAASHLSRQVFFMLVLAPIIVMFLGLHLIPLAVEVSLGAQSERAAASALNSARMMVIVIALCAIVVAASAAAILRASMRTAIDQIRKATDAIADGNFSYRINTKRKDEFASLANSIDRTAMRLEQYEASRRQVFAGMSHELKTPMTVINGVVFTLARTETDPERIARFELVNEEIDRLASLLNDLIENAGIRAGGVKLKRSTQDIVDIVERSCLRFEIDAQQAQVTIKPYVPEHPVLSEVDTPRLDQILGNLITNAIRFANPNSEISIRVEAGSGEGGLHIIDVENDGPSISLHERSNLFKPFAQGARRPGKMGLGLCIASDLAKAHGGQLILRSKEESPRTVFRILLPISPPRSDNEERRSTVTTKNFDLDLDLAT